MSWLQRFKKSSPPAGKPADEADALVLKDGTKVAQRTGIPGAYGLGVRSDGVVYVPLLSMNAFVVLNPDLTIREANQFDGQRLKTVSWPPAGGTKDPDQPGIIGPHSVEFGSDGSILISELYGRRVTQVDAKGDLIRRIGRDGPEAAQLEGPTTIRFDGAGHFNVGDYQGSRIVRYDRNGKFVDWWGSREGHGRGIHRQGRAQKDPQPGGFDRVHEALLGPDGLLYLSDTWNHRIQRFTIDGEFRGWLGASAQGDSVPGWRMDGVAKESNELGGLNAPTALVFDARGEHFYVADCYNFRVQRFRLNGEPAGWLGGDGKSGLKLKWRTDGVPAKLSGADGFSYVYDVKILNGAMYIADTHNQRVLMMRGKDLGL